MSNYRLPLLVLLVCSSGFVSAASRSEHGPSAAGAALLSRTRVAHYRAWTRVNPHPVVFRAAPAEQCAGPSPEQTPSIHRDKYITVFVNLVGRPAMLGAETPAFPAGAVVVKEKLTTPTSKTPELMTVMVKRESGYDTEHGDWEYAVLDGKTRQPLEEGRLPQCQSCHDRQREQGYVFRDAYLPRPK